MTRKTKMLCFGALVVLSVITECVGVYKLVGSVLGGGSAKGVMDVLVGLLIGLPSAILFQYFKFSPDISKNKDNIAVETLSKIASRNRQRLIK